MSASGRDYYSLKEVQAILSHISDADRVRLRQLAHFQAMKLRAGDPDELLAEGLTRVLEGKRQWPRGLEFGPFMFRVFGSIVSAEAKHDALVGQYEVDTEVDCDGQVHSPSDVQLSGISDEVPESVHAQEMLSRLMAKISGDQGAIAVAMARAEGLSALEAQKQFKLSGKEYDAARKRLYRAVKAFASEEVVS